MSFLRAIAAVSILWLLSPAAMAASFDCRKASRPDEKLICSDPELSRLDETLNTEYQRAIERLGPDKEILQQSQRDWLKSYGGLRKYDTATCDTADCLKGAFASRITVLKRIASTDYDTSRWNGRYVRYRQGKEDPQSSSILLLGLKDGGIYADGFSVWEGESGQYKGVVAMDEMNGVAGKLKEGRAIFDRHECTISMEVKGNILVVKQEAGCNQHATFTGGYRKQ